MCCRKNSIPKKGQEPGSAGYWGSRSGDCYLPIQTYRAFLKFASTKIEPEFVIWLGDNEDHELDEVSQNYNFETTKQIAEETKAAFSKSHIQFVVGNHQAFPVDNVDIRSPNEPKTGVWYYEKFLSAYDTLIPVEQRIDFNNRGYYSQYFADYNVRFINIDTLAMDYMNFYMFVHKFDPNGMFEWMWYI